MNKKVWTVTCFAAFQLIAFWPVWSWYVQRMSDGSDEPWGIVALLTAAFFIFNAKQREEINASALMLSLVAALLYAVGYSQMPMLLRAVIAVVALAFGASGFFEGRTVRGGVLGLLVLSLPIIASLQFYLGYPVRLLTAAVSATMLTGLGYPVDADGTLLLWAGELVSVDAPCSGIKMLWTGMFLNFTIACANDLGMRSTWLSYVFAAICVFIGNVVRASILFFPEAGIFEAPQWFHSAAGIAVFAFVAGAILQGHSMLRNARI
ncbi:MAG: archaeosortase/exosortase family protein [Bdellovibrionales bacterium]|nr:archaeosortase/exosortase family protein [Bdellovibrionales bacterium]